MARLKSNRNQDPLVALNQKLGQAMAANGELAASVSMESFNYVTGGEASNIALNELDSMDASLESIFSVAAFGQDAASRLGFGGEIKDSQREAVKIIVAALQNPAQYHRAAMNVSVESSKDITLIEPSTNPAFGYRDTAEVSLEAFDASALSNLRGYNVLYAFSSAVQDEFGELAFRTVTLAADNAGLELSIRRTMVQEEIRHPITGEFVEWKQRNLLDAVTDTSILLNEATRIYPRVIIGDAESEANFVTKTLIAPKSILANGGAPINTAPLRAGKKLSLIGISQNDKTGGTPDQTDSLAADLRIAKAYFRVKTSSGESVIALDTSGLARNNFLKANQGKERRVDLNFDIRDLVISGQTLDIEGNPAQAFSYLTAAPLNNVEANFEVLLSGNANLMYSNIYVIGGNPEFLTARDLKEDGTYETIVDKTTIAMITAEIEEFEFLGYDVIAHRSNINRRQVGTLVDSLEERVRYIVPISSPISLQTPITDTATAADLAAPLNAQRLTNSINAVTKILEVRDTLRAVGARVGYGSPTDPAPEIEGFARLMVRPIIYDDKLNVANVISNLNSSNRTQDLMATIVNKIRFAVTSIYTESRYQPALDAVNGTPGDRPEVMIGTDPTIASYIAVSGDWRTLIGFDARVVVSYDYRMRGKIFCTFVRPKVNDVDIMSFGAMAYVPELVTNAMIPYNGANTQVTQVQNRTLHVCTLPVMAWIEVSGLEQAASEALEYKVDM